MASTKRDFIFAYVHNIHVLYSFMLPFHLDKFLSNMGRCPGTFYALGMFDVSGTKEASKANSEEIRDV